MKQSDINEVLKERLKFSSEYSGLTYKNESGDSHFSAGGCEVCNIDGNTSGGAGDVIEVTYTDINDFNKSYDGFMCGGCLCAIVNSDDSDLDYSLSDTDCEPLDISKYSDILNRFQKDLGNLLQSYVSYNDVEINYNGETTEKTINECVDYIDLNSSDDDKIIIFDLLENRSHGELLELLANDFDFSFNSNAE